ncbi:SCO family protein [Bacillus sp. DJP31]|uniref:SCO family protein n=1 Tax=Bacillus sp. DJP31 TaxID=3409789 RepID=UPI003BB66333
MKKWLFALLAIAGFLLVYFFWPQNEELPKMKKITPFTAETMEGAVYESQNDKLKIVAFFYTNCPDICPMTFVDLKQLQQQLKEAGTFGNDVEFVTITLDPEYDTKEILQSYAENFEVDPEGWKILRTTLEGTEKTATDFQMNFKKEGDLIAHRTTMFLVDADHNIRALYSMAIPGEKADISKIAGDIQLLLE